MEEQIVPQIDILVKQLNSLKKDFDDGIIAGKPYLDVKLVYLQMKELERLIAKLSDGRAIL